MPKKNPNQMLLVPDLKEGWRKLLYSNSVNHDLEMFVVCITPEMAERLLKRNDSNRNIRQTAVKEYVESMEKGRWKITGHGISLDPDGNVLDGQHRLMAIIAYGFPVETIVVIGIEPGAQQYMDTGRSRKISDILKMFDGVKNAGRTVATVRFLNVFDRGFLQPGNLDDCREVIKEYKKQFEWISGVKPGQAPRTALFYAPLVWAHRNGLPDEAEMFLQEMSTLEGLSAGSPVLALKHILDNRKLKDSGGYRSLDIALLTFNALHAYVEGKKVKPRNIHMSTVGFDFFKREMTGLGRRRRGKSSCEYSRPCSFDKMSKTGGVSAGLCWLHLHYGNMRN